GTSQTSAQAVLARTKWAASRWPTCGGLNEPPISATSGAAGAGALTSLHRDLRLGAQRQRLLVDHRASLQREGGEAEHLLALRHLDQGAGLLGRAGEHPGGDEEARADLHHLGLPLLAVDEHGGVDQVVAGE